MRHFSNIMPNFAAYLHLLVDSIPRLAAKPGGDFWYEKFGGLGNFVYICSDEVIKKVMMLKTEECKRMLSRFKEEHQEDLGIKSIGIFGSVARGDNDAESDIDVFVELDRPAFSTMFTIHQMLEELFGCKVDLVRKRESLRPLFKRNLEKDAIYA